MSRTIDERVVEMRFDNKQFEAGTNQTMGTLGKLKEALKLPDVSKGFDNLQKSANQVDMSGLGGAIEGIKVKFSALEVAAITALSNIVNRAVDAGIQLAKSLSIDQISAGFSEYELKMGSIQTIMASTGESLSTVNSYLEELNRYSDKTIYSFSDMTQNIGKFTNAGVKLEDAVKAIQGVSNEAAVSGANANEASRAMYNFAQALSAGYVKLIDWKSIENANMATVEFKNQLIDTALAMGTVVEEEGKFRTTTTNMKGEYSDLFDATSAFNDSLSHQWITTDVLIQTLSNYSTDVREMTDAEKKAYEEKLRGIGYTDEQIKAIEELGKKAFDSAQDVKTFHQLIDTMRESVGSGWAQTFELIFGDFEEAKMLWSNVNKVLGSIIQESSDSRNELLRGWKEAGGRDALLGGVSNAFNALLSVVKAVKEAFRSVFPKTTSAQLVEITKGFQNLTAKLKPSNAVLDKLKRTFTGLFSIIDIVAQVIGAFFKLLVPGVAIVGGLGEGILDVTASIGDWITNLDKAIKENGVFIKAIEKIRDVIGYSVDGIEGFINKVGGLFESLFDVEGVNFDGVLEAFNELALAVSSFSFDNVEASINSLKEKIKGLLNVSIKNEGLLAFIENLKQFGEGLREAFSFDNLLDRVERVMDVFGRFFNWIKENIGPAFEDFSFGATVAAGGGLGIIYAIVKIAKSLENVSKSISSIPNFLGGIKDTLTAYQNDLKADTLLKISAAIAVLAGALVLLSFTDTDRLLKASTALALVAGTLLFGISKLLEAMNKGKEVSNALDIFAEGLSATMQKFGKAAQIKAIGGAIKNLAISIGVIAASIIALGIMYNKDKDALMAGVEIVGLVGLAMVGIMTGMSILGNVMKGGGMKQFATAALGILALSASLTLCINALNKLFNMEFPSDWEFKMKVLAGMLGGLGILALVLGTASRIAGNNKLSSKAVVPLAVLLITTVLALDKLFKMEFPPDWQEKILILAGIFAGFGTLMLTLGAASRLAGGSMKAAGTILAMCAFVGVIVTALMVLTLVPAEKLMKGAVALGTVLTTLGVALFGAGKITTKDTYKSVLAMAVAVGAIAASLGILAVVPFSKLLQGATVLGAILLALAENFKQVSKITNQKAWMSIAAMIASIIGITVSLAFLATQPWEGLLAGAASLSLVLLSLSKSFQMVLEKNWSKNGVKKIGIFLLMTTSLIPITAALAVLANQPWEGMLAAGTALSGVLLAMSVAFQIVSSVKPDVKAIATFAIAMGLLSGVVALELYKLAEQPWTNVLGAAASISLVLIAMSGCLAILTATGANIGTAIQAALSLSAFVAVLGAVMIAIGALFSELSVLESFLDKGIEILIKIGNGLGRFVGAIVEGLVTQAAQALPGLGENLSSFYNNGSDFFNGIAGLNDSVFKNIGLLASALLKITVAELISGIARLFGSNLSEVGEQLSDFYDNAKDFLVGIKDLKPEAVEGAKKIAEMILALTAADIIAGIGRILGFGNSLADFGKELAEFGPYIKQFSEDVKGVKPEAVQGAASAAEIMADLAKKLPGTGGLAQKIFGERSLSDFGAELVEFGPSIKTFGETVKGVKPEAVQGAASAAEIMSNLANKLPPQGGLVEKIFGERSLADFGAELVKFGPRIALFATQVKDVEPSAIIGVSTITRIMSDLATNLPASESLWDKIFGGGQVSLSEFGNELVRFGYSMSSFSTSVADLNTEQINAAVTGFKDLVDLTKYIEGASATDLVSFSNELYNIGVDSVDRFVQAFTDAGPKAETAVVSLFGAITAALKSEGGVLKGNAIIVGGDLCLGLQNGIMQKQPLVISTEKNLTILMTNTFRTGLPTATFNTIGQNVVQGIINGINAKKPLTLSTVKNLCVAIISQFRISLPTSTFNVIGQNVVQGIINGINAKKPLALSTVSNICSAIISEFRTGLPSVTFTNFGLNIVAWIAQGISNKRSDVVSASSEVCSAIVNTFRDNLSQSTFYDIGANAALGVKYGIQDKIGEIGAAAAEAASQAVESARAELEEHSPSKVMHEVGEFFSIGLAEGILAQIRAIALAGTKAADHAISPVKQAVDGITSIIDSDDFDFNPVIRPVVDLSDVQRGANDISSLMNQRYDLSSVYNRAMDTSASFSGNRKTVVEDGTSNSKSGGGDTYEFNQYNYSPKALSRSEIYRQTNNQFSAFRRAVNPT